MPTPPISKQKKKSSGERIWWAIEGTVHNVARPVWSYVPVVGGLVVRCGTKATVCLCIYLYVCVYICMYMYYSYHMYGGGGPWSCGGAYLTRPTIPCGGSRGKRATTTSLVSQPPPTPTNLLNQTNNRTLDYVVPPPQAQAQQAAPPKALPTATVIATAVGVHLDTHGGDRDEKASAFEPVKK